MARFFSWGYLEDLVMFADMLSDPDADLRPLLRLGDTLVFLLNRGDRFLKIGGVPLVVKGVAHLDRLLGHLDPGDIDMAEPVFDHAHLFFWHKSSFFTLCSMKETGRGDRI